MCNRRSSKDATLTSERKTKARSIEQKYTVHVSKFTQFVNQGTREMTGLDIHNDFLDPDPNPGIYGKFLTKTYIHKEKKMF